MVLDTSETPCVGHLLSPWEHHNLSPGSYEPFSAPVFCLPKRLCCKELRIKFSFFFLNFEVSNFSCEMIVGEEVLNYKGSILKLWVSRRFKIVFFKSWESVSMLCDFCLINVQAAFIAFLGELMDCCVWLLSKGAGGLQKRFWDEIIRRLLNLQPFVFLQVLLWVRSAGNGFTLNIMRLHCPSNKHPGLWGF